MGHAKILTKGERALLSAAFKSFSSRLKSKFRRVLKREPTQAAAPENIARNSPLFLSTPSISAKEVSSLMEAMVSGWDRKPVRQFERLFAAYLGTPHALATSSCTGALHLALRAMNIGAGDEVLVPESTWIATASAVLICGATPVLVDVDPITWCMDPASACRAITPRTRAMIPVHLYGRIGDMTSLTELARETGLKVIEDAAAAVGSAWNGMKAGTFGDAAAFSFHSTKILTTAEGGMLVTANPDLFNRAHSLATHGVKDDDQPHAREAGVNYKMSHLHAAIGIAQLERIDELLSRKRRLFEWYEKRLKDVEGLIIDSEFARTRSNCWMFVVMLQSAWMDRRDSILAGLKQEKINAAPFAAPLSSLPMFESHEQQNPHAYDLGRRGILLPSGLDMSEADVDRVCLALRKLLADR